MAEQCGMDGLVEGASGGSGLAAVDELGAVKRRSAPEPVSCGEFENGLAADAAAEEGLNPISDLFSGPCAPI